jgi:hypothetical protein
MAIPLLAGVARPTRLLADKAYADSRRKWLKQRKGGRCIHRLKTDALPSRRQSLEAGKRHRTNVLQAEELHNIPLLYMTSDGRHVIEGRETDGFSQHRPESARSATRARGLSRVA